MQANSNVLERLPRKTIAVLMSAVLVSAFGLSAFSSAAEAGPVDTSEVDANVIERATGTDTINVDTTSDAENIAIADGEEVIISIPRSGDDEVIMDDGLGVSIGMALPKEVENSRASKTDDGTIVYESSSEDVVIGVQPLQEEIGDDILEGFRTTVTIENASAPHEYSFEYNLAKGYKLVTSREFFDIDEYDTGEVYIVDSHNELVEIIDSAWAKDSNGQEVATHYEVDGSTLVQVVDFDENTAFPVVADPTARQVAACVGTLAVVIGSYFFLAFKLVGWLAKVGGIVKGAKKLGKAIKAAKKKGGNWKKKIDWSSVGNGIAAFGAELVGIADISRNCSW